MEKRTVQLNYINILAEKNDSLRSDQFGKSNKNELSAVLD